MSIRLRTLTLVIWGDTACFLCFCACSIFFTKFLEQVAVFKFFKWDFPVVIFLHAFCGDFELLRLLQVLQLEPIDHEHVMADSRFGQFGGYWIWLQANPGGTRQQYLAQQGTEDGFDRETFDVYFDGFFLA